MVQQAHDDPYETLGLPHDASPLQIKTAYRRLALAYHPDRLTRQQKSPEEIAQASTKFAKAAAAYALLSDDNRKRQYDHIYKYGGFDPVEEKKAPAPAAAATSSKKNPQKGIGYSVSDPLAFILSQGKNRSTTIAGVQIPSRFHMAQPGGGLRFAVSSGQVSTSPTGTRTYVSKTTQFVQGKTFRKVETTTIQPDGRKEVVIEGDDYVERRYSRTKRRTDKEENMTPHHDDSHLPWYMNAWNGIRDKLTMCHNPCGTIAAV